MRTLLTSCMVLVTHIHFTSGHVHDLSALFQLLSCPSVSTSCLQSPVADDTASTVNRLSRERCILSREVTGGLQDSLYPLPDIQWSSRRLLKKDIEQGFGAFTSGVVSFFGGGQKPTQTIRPSAPTSPALPTPTSSTRSMRVLEQVSPTISAAQSTPTTSSTARTNSAAFHVAAAAADTPTPTPTSTFLSTSTRTSTLFLSTPNAVAPDAIDETSSTSASTASYASLTAIPSQSLTAQTAPTSSSLSPGATFGIVAAALLAAACIGGIGFYYLRKRRQGRPRTPKNDEADERGLVEHAASPATGGLGIHTTKDSPSPQEKSGPGSTPHIQQPPECLKIGYRRTADHTTSPNALRSHPLNIAPTPANSPFHAPADGTTPPLPQISSAAPAPTINAQPFQPADFQHPPGSYFVVMNHHPQFQAQPQLHPSQAFFPGMYGFNQPHPAAGPATLNYAPAPAPAPAPVQQGFVPGATQPSSYA